MRTFLTIMTHKCSDGRAEVRFAEQHHAVQALGLGGLDSRVAPGESHPRALPEPYVRLAPHTAPTIQPPASRRVATGQRAAVPVARCAPANAWTLALGAESVCISVAPPPRHPHSAPGAPGHPSTDTIGRSTSPPPCP